MRPRGRGLLPAALLAYHHVGYPLALWIWQRIEQAPAETGELRGPVPRVALVIPAHNEAEVIAAKVRASRALDYPHELLKIVVACDGCTDDTPQAARDAGADLVLELPRGGKMAAQHAAVMQLSEPIVAFSDANSAWEPGALRALVGALGGARVGYACGRVQFVQGDAQGAPTRRGSTGATRWRSGRANPRWPPSLRATARSTPSAARPTTPMPLIP